MRLVVEHKTHSMDSTQRPQVVFARQSSHIVSRSCADTSPLGLLSRLLACLPAGGYGGGGFGGGGYGGAGGYGGGGEWGRAWVDRRCGKPSVKNSLQALCITGALCVGYQVML